MRQYQDYFSATSRLLLDLFKGGKAIGTLKHFVMAHLWLDLIIAQSVLAFTLMRR